MATITNPYAERTSFEKTKSEIEFPDLLSVQVDAFQSFIQEYLPEDNQYPSLLYASYHQLLMGSFYF